MLTDAIDPYLNDKVQYDRQRALALVEKSRSYGPETDPMTEQLAAAIDTIDDLKSKLLQADGMVQAMLNYQRHLNRGLV